LYGYRGVYAPDALWDAYLRSRAVAPNVYATTYLEPAALSGDRRIVRVCSRANRVGIAGTAATTDEGVNAKLSADDPQPN
jgi:hypothetical protein